MYCIVLNLFYMLSTNIAVDISEVHKSSEVKWKLNSGSTPIAINENNI